jgi:TonB family protein
MFKLGVALMLVFVIPAAAVDACSALNPIEIAATLRGPGVVIAFHSKTDQEHFRTCILARISQAGSFEENLKRFQSESPLTLSVAVGDGLGAKAFDSLLKTAPEMTSTEVPNIGDRSVLRRGTTGEMLLVGSGPNLLILALTGEGARGKREQDLLALAQEALATNFDGSKVVGYEVAERALANDKSTFEGDPKNFGLFLMAMKKFDQARVYNLQAAAINPDDTDVLYQQGVLNWSTTYQLRMEIRARSGLNPEQPLPAGPECAQVRSANHEKVEEGIADLSKAVKIRPDFDDAMAYLNLLYRERAEYECDDTAARASDLKTADDWVVKMLATKRANVGRNKAENVLSLFPPVPPPPQFLGTTSGSPPGGHVGGVIGGVLSSTPVPDSNRTTPQRVMMTSGVSSGLLLTKIDPVYPAVARQARVQGTVVLQAIIGRDGSIEHLSLVSGHPLLAPAAIDAVKQWKYKPYLLNSVPVEVQTQIEVNFALSGKGP